MPLRPLPIRDPARAEEHPEHARDYSGETGGWTEDARDHPAQPDRARDSR